ncbi:MAG: hypothetical protein FWG22_00595 [Prolixibacteraceae bacterium]|nr:hypothetical protein [Prolixibacteraceae bacterium]
MGIDVNKKVYLGANYIVSSLGFGTRENMAAIEKYCLGVACLNDNAISSHPFFAGKIDDNRLAAKTRHLVGFTRLEKLFILALENIHKTFSADFADPDVGFVFSTTKGNIDELQKNAVPPNEKLFLFSMAKRVLQFFDVRQDPIVISNACISGVSAIILGQRFIQSGKYKHVVVVGGDLLSRFAVSGFLAFRSVSPSVCRPFNADRDGLSMGEACGALLLTGEHADALKIEICGGAITNDANHISAPSRTGDGLSLAISEALKQSRISANDVGFINAHGTATPFNDEMESKAIHSLGLEAAPLNSLKPYFGHTLGAAGIVETIASAYQLRKGKVFATPGFSQNGVPFPLNISDIHLPIDTRYGLKLASGFGGCNAALIIGKAARNNPAPAPEPANSEINILKKIVIQPDGSGFPNHIRALYKKLDKPNMKFFKMDNLSKLGYIAAEMIFDEIGMEEYEPQKIAVVLANKSASLDTDIKHQQIIDSQSKEGASPAVFVYTLPNIVVGEICIRHKIQGENSFFIRPQYDNFVRQYAESLLYSSVANLVLCGWCELLHDDYIADFELLKLKNR